jgi:hypothetical protein
MRRNRTEGEEQKGKKKGLKFNYDIYINFVPLYHVTCVPLSGMTCPGVAVGGSCKCNVEACRKGTIFRIAFQRRNHILYIFILVHNERICLIKYGRTLSQDICGNNN